MNRVQVFKGLVAVALAVGLAGCEKEEAPKTPVPAPPAPDVTPKAGGTSALNGGPGATGGRSPTTAASAGAATRSTTGPSSPRAGAQQPPKDPADLDPPPVTRNPPGDQTRQAQELIAQAITAIKEKRLGDARASLDKVDAMKQALPRETYEQLITVRGTLQSVEKLQGGDDVSVPEDPDNK